MKITVKERTELLEKSVLSEYSMLAVNSKGRCSADEVCTFRTVYQVDRGRVVHSKAFRRLSHKTQVFIAPQGDHYRTRLTHTMEVAQIARNLARALRLNEDLTEAIALAHDLGHTPFGHVGEKALDDVSECGFKHYEQSLRVVDRLEKFKKGLNLTYEVRDGILNHTRGKLPQTLEGQLVRLSDRLAYINHDIDDAVRAKILSFSQFPEIVLRELDLSDGFKIDFFFDSIINNSCDGKISMSENASEVFGSLHAFLYDSIYTDSKAKSEDGKVLDLIRFLYEYLLKRDEKWPRDIRVIAEEEGVHRALCDYISGMTDRFAVAVFEDALIPRSWSIAKEV